MIQRLEEIYQINPKIMFYLKNAKQLLHNGNEDIVLQSLENILLNKKSHSKYQMIHEQIIIDTKNFGISIKSNNLENQCKFNYKSRIQF